MKDWFRTDNDQILNLLHCKCFWIENFETHNVFCTDMDNIDWKLAELHDFGEAQEYLNLIYKRLKETEKL